MRPKRLFFSLLLLILVNFGAMAQKQVTSQALYWTRYYNQLHINKNMSWHNEFDNRRFFDKNKQHHLIIHTRLHYKFIKNADAAVGMTYSLQSPQDPILSSGLIIPELRPNQEINLSNPYSKKFTLNQRLRIDERFIRKNNGTVLLSGYDFNFRFRYRLQATYKLSKDEDQTPTVLKLADEIMINAGKRIVSNHFDQNRIYAALEQGIYKNITAELGYLYWFQQRASGNQFFDRDIIRFTLNHKINL